MVANGIFTRLDKCDIFLSLCSSARCRSRHRSHAHPPPSFHHLCFFDLSPSMESFRCSQNVKLKTNLTNYKPSLQVIHAEVVSREDVTVCECCPVELSLSGSGSEGSA